MNRSAVRTPGGRVSALLVLVWVTAVWVSAPAALGAAPRRAPVPSSPLGLGAAVPESLLVDGRTEVMSGTHVFDLVTVRNAGVISVSAYAGVLGGGRLELRARRITVDATSRISAMGSGWRGIVEGKGEGPGGGEGGQVTAAFAGFGRSLSPLHATGSGAGGGYGGRGGDGIFLTNRGEWLGGRPYGVADGRDAQLGSAGGAAPRSHHETEYIRGGDGGGVIVLTADQVVIDGTVSADGEPGQQGQFDATGGGAGGTVLIEATQLAVTGRVSAAGAPGGQAVDAGGAGGGGRLKITARAPLPAPALLDVRAGQATGPCPGDRASPNGCPGTIAFVELPKPPPVYLPLILGRHCVRPDGRAWVLVLDTSHSMQLPTSAGRTAMEAAVAAADAFVARFGAYDRSALVSFAGTATLLQPLTVDHGRTRAALRTLTTGNGSRLDLGLVQGKAVLDAATPAERKVMVLVTDGISSGDAQAMRATASALRAGGTTLYALGFGAEVDAPLLAELTGTADRVLVAPDAEDLSRLYEAIGAREGCNYGLR